MSILYKRGPKKKREVFPSSWLSQFDLLGFDEKRGTMHLMFHFNETYDLVFKIPVPPFHFLYPQLYQSRGTKNPPVKNFIGHTAM